MSAAKDFHHFSGGYAIDDATINWWIHKALHKAVVEKENRWAISSGDTSVIAVVWYNRDGSLSEVEVFVCNDSGRSKLRFGPDDSIHNFNDYVRPLPKKRSVSC